MASLTYNEFTNSVEIEGSARDPMYYWDTHYPQRLSHLHLSDYLSTSPSAPSPLASSSSSSSGRGGSKNKKRRQRRQERHVARYKTQPITFDEIQEVDEEGQAAEEKPPAEVRLQSPSCDKGGFLEHCSNFSRSIDGIVGSSRSEKSSSSEDNRSAGESEHVQKECRARFLQRRRRYHTKSIEEDPAEGNKI